MDKLISANHQPYKREFVNTRPDLITELPREIKTINLNIGRGGNGLTCPQSDYEKMVKSDKLTLKKNCNLTN